MNCCKKVLSVVFSALIALSVISVGFLSVPVFATENTVEMVDMHEMRISNVEPVEEITDSYGQRYSSNILSFNAGEVGYVEYELNGKYSSFSGSLVAANTTNSHAKMIFSVFADGKEIYSISNYTRQMDAQKIELDLTNVNVLKFMSRDEAEEYDAFEYIVNGEFKEAETASLTYLDWDKLSDVVLVDSADYEDYNTLVVDVYGELYFNACILDATRNGYALFNLNKNYEKFKGYIFSQRINNADTDINISVFVDNKVVYTKKNIKKTTQAIPFEIDVSNAKTLKIETSTSDNDIWEQNIIIASSQLCKHQHKAGKDWLVYEEATCTEPGTEVKNCTECGEIVETKTIPAKGHNPDGKYIITKEPTCTEAGEEVQHCTVCKKATEPKEIPATGHKPDQNWTVIEEATCIKEGKEVRKCTVCGEVAETRTIEKKEHTLPDEWTVVTEPNCSQEGLRQKVCTVCGQVGKEEVLEKTDHSYGEWNVISGSVWDSPIVKERSCTVCGEKEHIEDSSTSWIKPVVIIFILVIIGGLIVIIITLKMNGLPLKPSSIKKLFSKNPVSDADIDEMLNK